MKSTVQGIFFGAAFCIEEVQCMCNAFSGIDKCDKLAELLACLLKANDKFGAHCTFLSESIEQLFRKSQSSIFNYYLEITPTNSMRMMCHLHSFCLFLSLLTLKVSTVFAHELNTDYLI